MKFEERNAALQKHVESMRTAVEKLEVDVIQERSRNTVLQQHLETLRQMLTSSFASMPLPGNVIVSAHCQWQGESGGWGLGAISVSINEENPQHFPRGKEKGKKACQDVQCRLGRAWWCMP